MSQIQYMPCSRTSGPVLLSKDISSNLRHQHALFPRPTTDAYWHQHNNWPNNLDLGVTSHVKHTVGWLGSVVVRTRRQNIWCYTAQHTTRRGGSHGQISTIKATHDAYGASWRGSGQWPVPPTGNERERERVVRMSDLWSRGREFDSRPVHCRVA